MHTITHAYTRTHTHTHTRRHACTHARTHARTHTHTHTEWLTDWLSDLTKQTELSHHSKTADHLGHTRWHFVGLLTCAYSQAAYIYLNSYCPPTSRDWTETLEDCMSISLNSCLPAMRTLASLLLLTAVVRLWCRFIVIMFKRSFMHTSTSCIVWSACKLPAMAVLFGALSLSVCLSVCLSLSLSLFFIR